MCVVVVCFLIMHVSRYHVLVVLLIDYSILYISLISYEPYRNSEHYIIPGVAACVYLCVCVCVYLCVRVRVCVCVPI